MHWVIDIRIKPSVTLSQCSQCNTLIQCSDALFLDNCIGSMRSIAVLGDVQRISHGMALCLVTCRCVSRSVSKFVLMYKHTCKRIFIKSMGLTTNTASVVPAARPATWCMERVSCLLSVSSLLSQRQNELT